MHSFKDFYHLEVYHEKIAGLKGFGERSFQKMQEAVEASRHTELSRVLFSLGISNIGRAASRLICAVYPDAEQFEDLTTEDLTAIDGIGDVLAQDFVNYFSDEINLCEFHELLAELDIEKAEEIDEDSKITGKTFVITGAVHVWKNRSELKSFIESNGGKVASAVSSKTDYLINNDSTSNSSKNKKAKELDIPILTEEEFQNLCL